MNNEKKPRILVSGRVSAFSGIGIIQEELYGYLKKQGYEIVEIHVSRLGNNGVIGNLILVIDQLLMRNKSKADLFISTTSPLPLFMKVPTISFVYDLRWKRVRTFISKFYRQIDLINSLRKSKSVICISSRVQEELSPFKHSEKVKMIHLGPGQISEEIQRRDIPSREAGTILLIGKAKHKNNENAVELISHLSPRFCNKVIAVSVSNETVEKLGQLSGNIDVELYEGITPLALADLYSRSEFALQLGAEEGFGLAYVEAISCGTIPVVIDQKLTRELLGGAAIFLADSDPKSMAEQLMRGKKPSNTSIIKVADKYSWSHFCKSVETEMKKLLQDS